MPAQAVAMGSKVPMIFSMKESSKLSLVFLLCAALLNVVYLFLICRRVKDQASRESHSGFDTETVSCSSISSIATCMPNGSQVHTTVQYHMLAISTVTCYNFMNYRLAIFRS